MGMSNSTLYPHSNINFVINQDSYPVYELEGEESLSEPFRFDIILYMPFCAADENYLYAPATLVLSNTDENDRIVSGIITLIECLDVMNSHQIKMKLRLQPRLAHLGTAKNCQLILNQSVIDISKQLLHNIGYAPQQLYFHCSKGYPTRRYTLQAPAESDLTFLQRLLANAGIFFWSSNDNHTETLHFSDDNQACSYLAPTTITYIPSAHLIKMNNDKQSTGSFYDLTIATQLVPTTFTVRDYHEHDNQHIIQVIQQANIRQQATITQNVYGTGISNHHLADHFAQLHAKRAALEQWQIHAKSHWVLLCAGSIIRLNAFQFNQTTQYNDEYLVLCVKHSFSLSQTISNARELTTPPINATPIYRNEITLIRKSTSFCPPLLPQPRMPACWISHIESDGDYPLLDEQSRYRVRHHFDREKKPNTQASIPIRRIMNYGGIAASTITGTHLPLAAGTEVIVSCLNGDLDCPVIIGSLPNDQYKSPVTASNKSQNILLTQQGNTLLFDDTIEKQKIQLSTAQAYNKIELNNNNNQSGINIVTTSGSMNVIADKDITLQCEQNMLEHSGYDRIHCTQNHYSIVTEQAEINYHAGTDQSFIGTQNVFLHAHKNMVIQSGQNVTLDIAKNAHISVQSNACNFTAVQGKITIQSAESIYLIGGGKADIQLVNHHAQLTIAADSTITCYGNVISLQAVNEILFKGAVQM